MTAPSCEFELLRRIASGLPSPERIGSAFEMAVMSSTPAREITGCIASVTGLFQPSMMTETPCETSSLARDTPTAGVDSSSRATISILRPRTPPLSLIKAAMVWIACDTCWPCGPAPPDKGKITPTLTAACAQALPAKISPRARAAIHLRICFMLCLLICGGWKRWKARLLLHDDLAVVDLEEMGARQQLAGRRETDVAKDRVPEVAAADALGDGLAVQCLQLVGGQGPQLQRRGTHCHELVRRLLVH